MSYNKLNNYAGWAVFAIGLIVYLLSVSPTASFWDCGEFIACANELQVPHPPGAPLFLMLGRLFAMLGGAEGAAYMVNLMSVLSGAFTVLFTFWITTYFARRAVSPNAEPNQGQRIAIMAAGAAAGLVCCFADSFWFNTVEAEVYAMSSFFTAIVVWLMLKWDARADQADNAKWLLLIAYLMGLSIGVHLLNLLTIPALVLMFYFRKYEFSWKGLLSSLAIAVGILGIIQYGIGQATFDIAWAFERLFTGYIDLRDGTNTGWGMAPGTGTVFWFILLFGALGFGIWWSHKKQKPVLNTALLGVLMVYLGISSYAMVMIRANAHPPINENDPSNMMAFLSYMKREQYGDRPLLKGPMYNAQPVAYEEGEGKRLWYKFDEAPDIKTWGSTGNLLAGKGISADDIMGKYILYDSRKDLKYAPGGERIFPRMYSREHYANKGVGSYINYVTDKGANPRDPMDDNPSGGDNLHFFFDYQVAHMYLRYFGWNFIGKLSDTQDSGVTWGVSPEKELSENDLNDPSHNNYYGLPLLLGLFGLIWQFSKRTQDGTIVAMLFFFTGLAIVLYLNQTPMQPRERDYSYAGSFQTFAIWVGLSVMALYELARKYVGNNRKINAYLASGLVLLAGPLNMGYSNFDDHSRAGRYVAPDSARNLLESCAPNAILFTNGDNDTFPLWYAQEVEGIRTDVRVINLSLLNTHWYIHHLRSPINDAAAVPLNFEDGEFYYMGEKNNARPFEQGRISITLPVDSAKVVENGIATPDQAGRILDEFTWTIKMRGGQNRHYLQKQDLMIIEMLKNIAENGWERPVYFAITIPPSSFLNLEPYFRQEGMAFRVVPMKVPESQGGRGGIAKDIMYENLMNKFAFRNLGDDSDVYLDANIRRMMGNFRNNYIRLALTFLTEADQLETRLPAFREANPDTVATVQESIQEYRQKAINLIQKMNTLISPNVARPASYVYAQMGQIYAQLSTKGFEDLREQARQYLDLARQNAMSELRFKYIVKGQKLNQRDPDFYALQIAFMTFEQDLRDAEGAMAVAQDFKEITGDESLLQRAKRLQGQPEPAPAPADTTATDTENADAEAPEAAETEE